MKVKVNRIERKMEGEHEVQTILLSLVPHKPKDDEDVPHVHGEIKLAWIDPLDWGSPVLDGEYELTLSAPKK